MKKSSRSSDVVALEMKKIELELYRLKLEVAKATLEVITHQGDKTTIGEYLALLGSL